MPEFGTIAMVVLAIAIIGVIAITARSRLTSNNVNMDVGDKTTMSDNIYKLAMIGILGIIIFGGYMAISGYNADIYPLDRIRGNLDGIASSSDPTVIRNHLVAIQADLDLVMANLPETTDESGNVWKIAGVNEISSLSKDNSAYHTGMLDINDRALLLKTNIMDATPYMYVSPENMMLSAIWIAVIVGILALLKRKKEQLQKEDEIGV
jgi:predicted secreted protein with PEFG-CTERM motif